MQVKHLQHAIDTQVPESGPGFHPRTLLLLGAGHAHLQVLEYLAKEPLVGVQVVLVAPHPRQIYFGRITDMVAGHCSVDDCTISLPALVQRAGVHWQQASVSALHADARVVLLDNGSEIAFDWVSINTGAVQDRDAIETTMPGARTHALFLRPIETFAALWSRVAAMGDARPLRVAVIGAGAAGVELTMALRHRLPHCALTLVCGEHTPGNDYPVPAQGRLTRALKQRKVTLLQTRAIGFHDGEVLLDNGARLACDVPLIAVGTHGPHWLQGCGLVLDAQGFVQVNTFQQSTSHAYVFATGDVSTRVEKPLPRSGLHAVGAGPTLVRNLAATTRGETLHAYQPAARVLHLLSCGDRTAIASWGNWSTQGRWVGWWKLRREQRFMARYKS